MFQLSIASLLITRKTFVARGKTFLEDVGLKKKVDACPEADVPNMGHTLLVLKFYVCCLLIHIASLALGLTEWLEISAKHNMFFSPSLMQTCKEREKAWFGGNFKPFC